MDYHTARLVVTIIFMVLSVSSLVTGYWFSAFFWGLLTAAVGYPFYRSGKFDMYYPSSSGRTVTIENIYTGAPPPAPVAPPAM
jgi:hypothetical protein